MATSGEGDNAQVRGAVTKVADTFDKIVKEFL